MTRSTPTPVTMFCLHALGASSAEFEPLARELGDEFEVVALDLPGFGGLSAATGVTVDEMVEHVIRRIRRHGATRWMLAGHSMGGKIATIVAARTVAGTAPLFGLAGVVLLAASPPSPEPMDDAQRAEMLGWAATGGLDAAAAREFIDSNVGAALPAASDALMLSDLRRASREAWIAWLQRGSREDRSDEVGELRMPALIVSGGDDGPLGPDGQLAHNVPVYPRAVVEVLPGAGHLLPLERPSEIAALISAFWREHAGTAPVLPRDVARVIASPRTSGRTRGILAGRALADDPRFVPRVLSMQQLVTLRAVADRVVPQIGARIDLAARLDEQLRDWTGDGWRNAALPPDLEAYRLALDGLAGFAESDPTAQDARLRDLGTTGVGELSPKQADLWFEDARVDLVRLWLAHPVNLARIGFDGFANGGDGPRLEGFTLLGAGERESWEPTMEASR